MSDINNKKYASLNTLKVFLDNLIILMDNHNISLNSHNDMRIKIEDVSTRLSTLADCDDETLDQISEIVKYIKDNRELIEQITTAKVSVDDIINNLETNVSNQPLSASQGVVIKQMINDINVPSYVSQLANDVGYLTVSNIPTVLATEEWNFGLEDGSIVTKTIVTTDSITNEELTFELEDGSIVTKRVVIE